MICKVCDNPLYKINTHRFSKMTEVYMCQKNEDVNHGYSLEIDHNNNIIEEYFNFGLYAILGINDTYQIYLYGEEESELIFSGTKKDFVNINLPLKDPIKLINKLNGLRIFI